MRVSQPTIFEAKSYLPMALSLRMTFVVPFDGSDLAETALVRAVEFSQVFTETVIAVTVIPEGNAEYAKERGWIERNESFAVKSVVERLHEQVLDLAPVANYRHILVDKYAPHGTISSRLRKFATKKDASMVFIGSENAGHMVTGVGSVGASVASEEVYDVVIIRKKSPSLVEKIRESSPYKTPKSGFYLR